MNGFNPYAPPSAEVSDFARGLCWRRGRDLILSQPPVFPPRCVKCNSPAASEPIRRTLSWGSLTTFGYRKVKVEVPLCPLHARRYRRIHTAFLVFRWISLVLVAAIFIIPRVLPEFVYSGYFIAVPMLLLVGALLQRICASLETPLKPRRIDQEFVHLRGAGKAFLDSLPDFPVR